MRFGPKSDRGGEGTTCESNLGEKRKQKEVFRSSIEEKRTKGGESVGTTTFGAGRRFGRNIEAKGGRALVNLRSTSKGKRVQERGDQGEHALS